MKEAPPETLEPLAPTSGFHPGWAALSSMRREKLDLLPLKVVVAPGIAAPDETENLTARLVPVEGGHLLAGGGDTVGVILGNARSPE